MKQPWQNEPRHDMQRLTIGAEPESDYGETLSYNIIGTLAY